MKVGEVFPDLHHKMSKKIAQLTKVIYHLNTKNEDRQARAEGLAGRTIVYVHTTGMIRTEYTRTFWLLLVHTRYLWYHFCVVGVFHFDFHLTLYYEYILVYLVPGM